MNRASARQLLTIVTATAGLAGCLLGVELGSEALICGQSTTCDDVRSDADAAGAPDTFSDTLITADSGAPTNSCGGAGALTSTPGTPCGQCDAGVWVCDGTDAVRCEGQTRGVQANGTCTLGPAPGSECGRCGGTWLIPPSGDPEDIYCSETAPSNACGGCGELESNGLTAAIGYRCEVGGVEGVVTCVSDTSLGCVPPDSNICGGTAELPSGRVPGAPCGTCLQGRWVCDGPDAIVCDGSAEGIDNLGLNEGVNLCDSCGPLLHPLNEPCDLEADADRRATCGEAAPVWQCNDGQVTCSRPARNACGGCGTLTPAATVGSTCDGGRWQCAGPDAIACAEAGPDEPNACGGAGELDGVPGQACGDCGNGVWVCADLNSVACVGDDVPNACGDCAPEWQPVGAACDAGSGRIWRCASDSEQSEAGTGIICALPSNDNGCGGSANLPLGRPLDSCGTCSFGRVACTGRDVAACVESTDGPPPLYYPDSDGDRYGTGAGVLRCGESTDGFALVGGDCDDTDGGINPGAVEQPSDGVDQNCDGRELCYEDNDSDGFVRPDARTVESLDADCDDLREADESYQLGDCDDSDADVAPLRGPPCLNCDERTAYGTACTTGFQGVVINEFVLSDALATLELSNRGDANRSLDGWSIVWMDGTTEVSHSLSDSTIEARRELAIELPSAPPDAQPVLITLYRTQGSRVFQDSAELLPLNTSQIQCRTPNGLGPWASCTVATLGSSNGE